jgi:CDP-4-dehydro-6-deoxyglucose reductase, E1
MKIPYGKNVYGKEEIVPVVNQLKKTTQMGKNVYQFKKIAKYVAKKYGVMFNSGTSALILAMHVMGIKKDDEIITPALNFGTAISSIIFMKVKFFNGKIL